MRTMEERKAEVYRRSRERIQRQRQRRKRVILSCIPAALCLAALWAAFPPASPAREYTAETTVPTESQVASAAQDSFGAALALPRVEIATASVDSRSLSEPDRVEAALAALAEITQSDEKPDTNDSDSVHRGPVEDQDGVETYTITVQNDAGTTVYLLAGHTLTDQTHQREYALTQAQAEALLDALGIPSP